MLVNKDFNKYEDSGGKIPIETELLFLSLVFSLILVFVFVVPGYRQMKIAEKQVKLIQKNIESKNNVFKKIKDYSEKNKTISEIDLEKLDVLLLEGDNTEKFIANINKIANTNGSRVFIRKFSVSKNKHMKLTVDDGSNFNLKSSNINFSVLGDFDNFMSFLNSIEKSIPLMEINNLNIRKVENENLTESKTENTDNSETDNKIIFIEADIVLSFYYL